MAEPMHTPARAKIRSQAGTGVIGDKPGTQIIDPTENVKALMAASLESVGKLRDADEKFNKAQFKHLKEIGDLRSRYWHLIRKGDLKTAEKTRQVDVLAAANSASQLATAVQALQSASDRNTETLRNQVSETAQAMAKQTTESAQAVQTQTDNLFRRTETAISTVSDRVGSLERANAAGAGRQSVVDPQITELIASMGKLVVTTAAGGGRTEGKTDSAKWIFAGIAALGSIVGILGAGIAVVIFIVKGG